MSIVNTKTFFFPKLYSLKVAELGETARNGVEQAMGEEGKAMEGRDSDRRLRVVH